MDNIYLEKWREITREYNSEVDGYFSERQREYFLKKDKLQRKFGWAIPDDRAIQVLMSLCPIVEIGAGRGYWAALICDEGGDIEAFDNFSWKYKSGFFPVEKGTERKTKHRADKTLFLCWPPFNNEMGFNSIKAHFNNGGKTVVYVGEQHGGVTGTDKFHLFIYEHYMIEQEIRIPQWARLYDSMFVLERK